ncbi:hatching enzyme 1.2-like isoform 2-T3 [Acanthopagrus schlegelii]
MKYVLGLLVLLTVSAWTKAGARTTAGALSQVVKKADAGNNNEDEGKLTVAEQLEKANNNLTSEELDIIKKGIDSFSSATCIRFLPRTTEKDFLYIQSLNGCYSYLGRQGYGQIVSLSLQGCIYLGTVQHELLHALGFNHEHCRSDRDQHVQVLLQNVMKGQDFNFKKVDTLNQETPYDYSSVMHYGRLAFSKDDHNPTMVAVPKSNSEFGTATEMNQNDINRINLLYCSD